MTGSVSSVASVEVPPAAPALPLTHLGLVVLITLIWGLNFIAIRYAVAELPPMTTNALRFAMVLAVLLPFLKPVRGRMGRLILTAVMLGVVHFGLVFTGMAVAEDLAPVIVAAQANVPFATLIAVVILGERIGPWRTAGIVLSFAGVLMMGLTPDTFEDPRALLIILASALAYAVVANLMRGLIGMSAFTVQAWVALMAVPGCLLLSIVTEQQQIERIAAASVWAWGSIAYSALLSTILGHGGMTWLLQRHPVTVIAPYLLLMPVFALLGAILIEDERLVALEWVGAATTLCGIGIISLRNLRRARAR
ncbi:MAG: DMT family transporter [Rhodothalassiaceae bacterium]